MGINTPFLVTEVVLKSRPLVEGALFPVHPERVTIDPVALEAFFELYHGMTSEESDRTGYDARVAAAIKTLKPFFERNEAKLQSAPSDPSPLAP